MIDVESTDVERLADEIAGDLKIFGVTKLFQTVGFGFDRDLNKMIMEQLREGHTVAVLKMYEPQDLPENHIVGEQPKRIIN